MLINDLNTVHKNIYTVLRDETYDEGDQDLLYDLQDMLDDALDSEQSQVQLPDQFAEVILKYSLIETTTVVEINQLDEAAYLVESGSIEGIRRGLDALTRLASEENDNTVRAHELLTWAEDIEKQRFDELRAQANTAIKNNDIFSFDAAYNDMLSLRPDDPYITELRVARNNLRDKETLELDILSAKDKLEQTNNYAVLLEGMDEYSQLVGQGVEDPELKALFQEAERVRREISALQGSAVTMGAIGHLERQIEEYRKLIDWKVFEVTTRDGTVRLTYELLKEAQNNLQNARANTVDTRLEVAEDYLKSQPERALLILDDLNDFIEEFAGTVRYQNVERYRRAAEANAEKWRQADSILRESVRIADPRERLNRIFDAQTIYPEHYQMQQRIDEAQDDVRLTIRHEVYALLDQGDALVDINREQIPFEHIEAYCDQAEDRLTELGAVEGVLEEADAEIRQRREELAAVRQQHNAIKEVAEELREALNGTPEVAELDEILSRLPKERWDHVILSRWLRLIEEAPTQEVYIALQIEDDIWSTAQTNRFSITYSSSAFTNSHLIILPLDATEVTANITTKRVNLENDARFVIPTSEQTTKRFQGYGTWPGDGEIKVEIFVDGELYESISKKVNIIVEEEELPPLPALPPPSQSADEYAHQPDLTLRFYTLPHGQGSSLIRVYGVAYSGYSYLKLEGYDLGFRDVPIQLIENIQQRLNILAEQYPSGPQARAELTEIGQFMWSYILPPKFEEVYTRVSKRKRGERISGVDSILILTDAEPWIPYELAVPPNGTQTLAEEFDVTRFIEGQGRIRQTTFPLGPVHQTVDADIQAALPDFRQLKWHEKMGLLNPDVSLKKGLSPQEEIAGFHIVKAGGSLRGRATALAEHTSEVDWTSYVQQRSEQLYSKSPLITVSLLSEADQGEFANVDELVNILKAGASAIVAKWWATSTAVDRTFWQAFYGALSHGKFLGDSISAGRRAVQTISDNPLDWLAFQGIGDPMATGYMLRDVKGILTGRCLNAHGEQYVHLKTGHIYRFIVTLRQKQPVFDDGPRYRIRPWTNPPTKLVIDAANCDVSYSLRGSSKLNQVEWEVELTPLREGRIALFIECFTDDDELFAELEKLVRLRVAGEEVSPATFSEPVNDVPQREIIQLDLTPNDHYLLRNKQVLYGEARPSRQQLKAFFVNAIYQLTQSNQTQLRQIGLDLAAHMAALLGEPWWHELRPGTHVQIFDHGLQIPWELSAWEDRHWGIHLASGHLHRMHHNPHESVHINRIAISVEESCAAQRGLFEFLSNQDVVEIIDFQHTFKRLSKQVWHTPAARIANSHARVKAQMLHLAVRGQAEDLRTNSIVLGHSTDEQIILNLDDIPTSTDGGLQLRNYPIVFLSQTTTNDISESSAFAYKFLEWGAQAVISPICTVPDDFAHAFAVEFYDQLFRIEAGSTLGEILLTTRESMFKRTKQPLSLAYVLFGDPLLKVEVG